MGKYLDSDGVKHLIELIQAGEALVAGKAKTVPAEGIIGTIPLANIPKAALDTLVKVADEAAAKKLTVNEIQLGDTVQILSTGKLYLCVDESKLATSSADATDLSAFLEYSAGSAASTDWSSVTSKPSILPATDSDTDKNTFLSTISNNVIPVVYKDEIDDFKKSYQLAYYADVNKPTGGTTLSTVEYGLLLSVRQTTTNSFIQYRLFNKKLQYRVGQLNSGGATIDGGTSSGSEATFTWDAWTDLVSVDEITTTEIDNMVTAS